MDEAVMLGLGNFLRENGYKEGSLLIREHCERVMDICKALGLKPMIWSDMYITANTRGGYYDVPENADCSQWEKPDRNLGLVYWDYYHDDIRDYEKMLGLFDYHVKASGTDIKAYYQEIYSCMSENCTKSAKYGLVFSFYEKLAAVLAGKADLGVRIKDAYDREEKEILKEISQNEIPDIICNLEEMKRIREEIWMTDAKPFGYELLDVKLGGVITRLKSTGRRIDNYLNGKVSRLEELEETRLPYFTDEMDKRENRWDRITSGCDLNDTI